jgi:hypothetical protein
MTMLFSFEVGFSPFLDLNSSTLQAEETSLLQQILEMNIQG